MNKTAIRNFSIWARNKLIADIRYRAGFLGITENGIQKPMPQSSASAEFYDIGTAEPYEVSGEAIRQRRRLAELIRQKEKDSNYALAYRYVIEEVAYTWFNRLIAVRFMEVNDYLPSHIRVLSSESGKIEPDLVTNPFDAGLSFTSAEEQQIRQWKAGNRIDDLFRLLFIRQCNALNELLPALFEETADYTELLLNLSVIDQDGVVWHLVHDIPEEDFDVAKGGQVEIIGWLYQYYNTEPKAEVFGRKSGTKIRKEDVPAATQLFTPDWIVRYMAENSLGRLWLDGHPESKGTFLPTKEEQEAYAAARGASGAEADPAHAAGVGTGASSYATMEDPHNPAAAGAVDADRAAAANAKWHYYLEEAPQEPEVQAQLDAIHSEHARLNLEDLTCIDPCMGSGHILVYLFDVLMQIYESKGWSRRDAAQSILQNNLYGLDIDERAAQMAYFAVLMKARQYDRRILSRGIEPHIYAISESNGVNRDHLRFLGYGLPKPERARAEEQMNTLLDALRDAKEYGSILTLPALDWTLLTAFSDDNDPAAQSDLTAIGLSETQELLLRIIQAGQLLSRQYHVVVTNPPYMGSSGMSAKLSDYVKKRYPDVKSDMSTVFMERCLSLCDDLGYISMINIPVWMFLSSYEKLRGKIIHSNTIVNMVHPGRGVFGSDFGTTTFVIAKKQTADYQATYCRLFDKQGEVEGIEVREQAFLSGKGRYTAKQTNFQKIPGSPVVYWAGNKTYEAFVKGQKLSDFIEPKHGLTTGNVEFCLRVWHECEYKKIGLGYGNQEEFWESGKTWAPHHKGGQFRKWYGNNEYVIGYNAYFNAKMDSFPGHRHDNQSYYFREGLTWTDLTSGTLGVRYCPKGFIFDVSGPTAFLTHGNLHILLGLMCSNVSVYFMRIMGSTLHFLVGQISGIPVLDTGIYRDSIEETVLMNVRISTKDWDAFETSWDFQRHPMLPPMTGEDGGTTDVSTLSAAQNKSGESSMSAMAGAFSTCHDTHTAVLNVPVAATAFGERPDENRASDAARAQSEMGFSHGEPQPHAAGLPAGKPQIADQSLLRTWSSKVNPQTTVAYHYARFAAECEDRFLCLKANEEELNRIFIDIYGLQDELTPDVADKDVTVRRYFDTKEDIPESMKGSAYALTRRDAVVSLISYAVGCMFGRYSLDEPGLAFAGGDWNEVNPYVHRGSVPADSDGDAAAPAGVAEPEPGNATGRTPGRQPGPYRTFLPDADNCIPIMDEEYFEDDIVGLFIRWLKAAYGDLSLEQNLDFIAKALGNRGNTSREIIRNYFLNDFFRDHCQTYSVTGSGKRPIYWLFDSGKQNGFKALVYMHRWNADTIGTVNADYLLRAQRVYESEMNRMQDTIDNSRNPREAAAASKRKEKLGKQLKECKAYYEKLSHLALERIDIDLDDGVKVNYRKVQTGRDGKFYEVLADSKNIMIKQ